MRMHRIPGTILICMALFFMISLVRAEEKTSENNPKLEKWLSRMPETDLNGDGILTESEARSFRESNKGKKGSEGIQKNKEEMVTMSAPDAESPSKYVYKTVGERELTLIITYPGKWNKNDARPAIVFFLGGGFNKKREDAGLSPLKISELKIEPSAWYALQLDYFTKRGMVTAFVEYRTRNNDGVLPDKGIEDAVSAMRWVRKNAGMLGVDPNRIVSAGSSSGGNLAASVFCIDEFQSPEDDQSVSPRPNAMILSNPLLDWLAPSSMSENFMDALNGDKDLADRLSPGRHWKKDMPPTLLILGTKDPTFAVHEAFIKKWKSLGSPLETYIGEGGHGFHTKSPGLENATRAADTFLRSIGYLKEEPEVALPEKEGKKKNREALKENVKSVSDEQSTLPESPVSKSIKNINIQKETPK